MLSDRDYMRPGARRPRFAAGHGSVLMPLIWTNVLVYVLTVLSRGSLIELLLLSPESVRRFEVWRFGTYLFVHGGAMHLLFNMWGLFIFGRLVERRIGPSHFLYLYLASGVLGGVAWVATNWGYRTSVVGASGSVFGVTMAAAMLEPNQIIMLLFPPIPMRLRTFVAVFVGIEVVQALAQAGGRIAHLAHLGGAVAGYLYIRRMTTVRRGGSPLAALRQWLGRRQSERRRDGFRVVDSEDKGTGADADTGPTITAEVDRILDKIGREGLRSLTQGERETLERARSRLRSRR